MKKLLLFLFVIVSTFANSQVTPLNVVQYPSNTVNTNTFSIGNKANRSLHFKTNDLYRFKIDSVGIFRKYPTVSTSTINGTEWYSTSTGFTQYQKDNAIPFNSCTNGTVSTGWYLDNPSASVPASFGSISNHDWGIMTNFGANQMIFCTTGSISIGKIGFGSYNRPASLLEIRSQGTTSTGKVFGIRNSLDTEESFKITDDGHMALGNTNPVAASFRMSCVHKGGATGTGIFLQGTIADDVITAFRGMLIQPSYSTALARGSYLGIQAGTPSLGSSTLTSLIYYDTGTELANVTGNTFAYFSRITNGGTGGQRWNFYSSGSAPSYLSFLAVGSASFLPTALVHMRHGTTVASTAPLKFTTASSAVLTTPEAGAMETDVNGVLYYTPVSTRYQVGVILKGSGTLDFGNTVAGTSTDLTITVTGAVDGDPVMVGPVNASTNANGIFTAWVSAANTVTVRFTNTNLVTAIDPASGTFKVTVNKN